MASSLGNHNSPLRLGGRSGWNGSAHTGAIERLRPGRPLARIASLVCRWMIWNGQRRQLLTLPDDMLKDIGLTQAEAWREGSKPFWQA